MIERDNIYIDTNDDLELRVIGYPGQGESIILNIGNKFVGVIDCFKTSKQFITKHILEKIGAPIDFICWTHTDWDHTYGFSELEEFIYENTAVVLPCGIQAKEWKKLIINNVRGYQADEYNKVFHMFEKIPEDRYMLVNESSEIYNFLFISGGEEISFSVKSFAPMSKIIKELECEYLCNATNTLEEQREKIYKLMNHDNNLFSVGIVIEMNVRGQMIRITLTGDLEDRVIEKMNKKAVERHFSRNNVLKIPHHGSPNSRKLIDYDYSNGIKFDYAITTSWKDELPKTEVLEEYYKHGNVIQTNKLNIADYGTVLYKFNLSKIALDYNQNVDVNFEGNADYLY